MVPFSAGPSLGFYKGSATINEMLGGKVSKSGGEIPPLTKALILSMLRKHSEAAANDLTNNFSLFRNKRFELIERFQ